MDLDNKTYRTYVRDFCVNKGSVGGLAIDEINPNTLPFKALLDVLNDQALTDDEKKMFFRSTLKMFLIKNWQTIGEQISTASAAPADDKKDATSLSDRKNPLNNLGRRLTEPKFSYSRYLESLNNGSKISTRNEHVKDAAVEAKKSVFDSINTLITYKVAIEIYKSFMMGENRSAQTTGELTTKTPSMPTTKEKIENRLLSFCGEIIATATSENNIELYKKIVVDNVDHLIAAHSKPINAKEGDVMMKFINSFDLMDKIIKIIESEFQNMSVEFFVDDRHNDESESEKAFRLNSYREKINRRVSGDKIDIDYAAKILDRIRSATIADIRELLAEQYHMSESSIQYLLTMAKLIVERASKNTQKRQKQPRMFEDLVKMFRVMVKYFIPNETNKKSPEVLRNMFDIDSRISSISDELSRYKELKHDYSLSSLDEDVDNDGYVQWFIDAFLNRRKTSQSLIDEYGRDYFASVAREMIDDWHDVYYIECQKNNKNFTCNMHFKFKSGTDECEQYFELLNLYGDSNRLQTFAFLPFDEILYDLIGCFDSVSITANNPTVDIKCTVAVNSNVEDMANRISNDIAILSSFNRQADIYNMIISAGGNPYAVYIKTKYNEQKLKENRRLNKGIKVNKINVNEEFLVRSVAFDLLNMCMRGDDAEFYRTNDDKWDNDTLNGWWRQMEKNPPASFRDVDLPNAVRNRINELKNSGSIQNLADEVGFSKSVKIVNGTTLVTSPMRNLYNDRNILQRRVLAKCYEEASEIVKYVSQNEIGTKEMATTNAVDKVNDLITQRAASKEVPWTPGPAKSVAPPPEPTEKLSDKTPSDPFGQDDLYANINW